MITALHIQDLALQRGDRVLLEGFALSLTAGEAVTLSGRNGAGKTSLLRAIAGLIRQTAGHIAFEGASGVALEPDDAIARHAHLLGHQDGLKLSRQAGDEARFQAQWCGGSAVSAAVACARLGLEPVLALPVRKLSAGQRRRLALARLLAAPRSLWLLDEPLAPLDRNQRAAFGGILSEHLADGGLVLAAAHDPLPVAAREIELP